MCVGLLSNYMLDKTAHPLHVCLHLGQLFVCIWCFEARIGLSVTVKSGGVGGEGGVRKQRGV